jgi:hypothetical protein
MLVLFFPVFGLLISIVAITSLEAQQKAFRPHPPENG